MPFTLRRTDGGEIRLSMEDLNLEEAEDSMHPLKPQRPLLTSNEHPALYLTASITYLNLTTQTEQGDININ